MKRLIVMLALLTAMNVYAFEPFTVTVSQTHWKGQDSSMEAKKKLQRKIEEKALARQFCAYAAPKLDKRSTGANRDVYTFSCVLLQEDDLEFFDGTRASAKKLSYVVYKFR